ncbi:hypothetical protein KC640_01275 [Candidatus Dojkabacteria bacterium]|uniref:Prepilin-type N-terminal cleavage/methylation domain-containing protein n=1 Tax=Candidatus Dojkabacteria bacterium TaxID=2099670 RepID=A0A955L034_9BACT|nr:hypothetical protein [Candidatus Dojkabacteria bacterium]
MNGKKLAKIPAFGLMEVMIVLAIVAATMVAAMQVSIQSLRVIKQNEIGDYANSVMVQALELAKSPSNVQVSATGQVTDFQGTYQLQINSAGGAVLWKVGDNVTPITNTGCTNASPYFVDISNINPVGSPVVCLQLIVRNISGISGAAYEITSHLIYTLQNEQIERSIIGYRRNKFEYVAQ